MSELRRVSGSENVCGVQILKDTHFTDDSLHAQLLLLLVILLYLANITHSSKRFFLSYYSCWCRVEFTVVEWSEQLKLLTSVWLGAVRRRVQIRLCTSGCEGKSKKTLVHISPQDLLLLIAHSNQVSEITCEQ